MHDEIRRKLSYYHKKNAIPNIIFHGPPGCGKKTIVMEFIMQVYSGDKEVYQQNVLTANCAHFKGIKFIREELKFFAKMHIPPGVPFKSIILCNADKLTVDAQSALRRCIEQFSHTTRFFMIVEDKDKLLKPILSRFCDVFVPLPYITKNYYQQSEEEKEDEWLNKEVTKKLIKSTCLQRIELTESLYSKGYAAIDILDALEKKVSPPLIHEKCAFLLFMHAMRKEIRNERLLLFLIVNALYHTNAA